MFDRPHRRINALTGEGVLVSPHRTQRPWQGRNEAPATANLLQYDPHCYLCPGNVRANGERNPAYQYTYAFENDYQAMLADGQHEESDNPLLRADSQNGTCRVICFSPHHNLTLAQMTPAQIGPVVDLWAKETLDLARRWRWVQVFENKGEIMGCSNPHPHGQIWATDTLPNEPQKELSHQRAWYSRTGRPLLIDYADLERKSGERVIMRSAHWLAVVPWWAVWPYEALILPVRHVQRIYELTTDERKDLAVVLQDLLSRYDRLFDTSFPYSMGWHGAPNDDGDHTSWQLHAHIYPPLLRSATIKKFMVGYELLAEPQRDITPEQAARQLRELMTGSSPIPSEKK